MRSKKRIKWLVFDNSWLTDWRCAGGYFERELAVYTASAISQNTRFLSVPITLLFHVSFIGSFPASGHADQ